MDRIHFSGVCSSLLHFYSDVIRLYRVSPAGYCGYGNVFTACVDAESHGASGVMLGFSNIFDRMAGCYEKGMLGEKMDCLCSL